MHPNSDELNELARRLSSYSPATAGLDADAALFAAGRAFALRGPAQVVWWGLTASLTALVVVLGGFLTYERNERFVLAQKLRQIPPGVAPNQRAPVDPSPADDPGWTPVLIDVHQALEQGRDPWPAQSAMRVETPATMSYPPVLQPRGLDRLLDP
jgi:hypothetical protein